MIQDVPAAMRYLAYRAIDRAQHGATGADQLICQMFIKCQKLNAPALCTLRCRSIKRCGTPLPSWFWLSMEMRRAANCYPAAS
jgi:hypothetical protein